MEPSPAIPPLIASSRLRRTLHFFLRRPLGLTILTLILTSGLGWAWWYNEHRSLSWSETFNVMYWVRHYRGDDLYLADLGLLRHGNRGLREVALTFDDGPHAESRSQILDILRKYRVHATFFDVGRNIALHPDLVRRTLQEGHEEGDHSNTHQRLDGLLPKELHHEINDADITYFRVTGRHLTLLRPPGMRYNPKVLAEARALGYIVVGYTTASKDFNLDEDPTFIVRRTLNRTDKGSIILLHDYPSTAIALPGIIQALQARGYHMVTISEMIDHLPSHPRTAARKFIRTHTFDSTVENKTTNKITNASPSKISRSK